MTFEEIAALDAAHVMGTYARLPVAFVRGEGARLWDSEGREYLDFLGGLAVVSLGHAHPEVADAIAEAARTLLHVSNLYYTDPQPRLAAELNGLLGGGGRVFFANSGAEANECAIKLARRYGQKHGVPHTYHVVSANNSFHGRTLTTLAATGQPVKQAAFQPLAPGFWQVPYGDLGALEEQAERFEGKLAAILLEVVQGEGGVWPAPPGYLEAVRALCDRTGALLVVDEVQTGLGRTGKWFGFEHFLPEGIRPDIVTMAKALGNGMPIGACWATGSVASAFELGDHATTFGGQPLAARAALATLAVMQREDVPQRAARAGARLAEGLGALPGVAAVRGLGLLLAAELAPGPDPEAPGPDPEAPGPDPEAPGPDAKVVAAACLDAGLVVNAVTATALRFEPPLLVTDAEIDEALRILGKVLA